MLDKAIATLGSVGVELYPDFNVFEIAKPYARELMVERYTPHGCRARARKEARELARDRPRVPYQMHDILEQVREASSRSAACTRASTSAEAQARRRFNRLVVALVVAGGLIGSSLIGIFADGRPAPAGPARDPLARVRLSGVLGVWLMWGVIRSGRL